MHINIYILFIYIHVLLYINIYIYIHSYVYIYVRAGDVILSGLLWAFFLRRSDRYTQN